MSLCLSTVKTHILPNRFIHNLCVLQQMESTLKQQLHQKKKKWFLLLIASLFFSSLLIILSIFVSHDLLLLPHFSSKPTESQRPIFVESKIPVPTVSSTENRVPRLAYLISGSTGDGESLKRTLKALYHPLNQYVVHLDLEASAAERMDLARFVEGDGVFREIGNVRVVVRSNLVTYRGPTMVSNTLHAAAILLKEGGDWDWFINLSASDYPLVTQDDLLHALSSVPRHLNFIDHTSDIGWKEFQRAKPVIIDPGLYSLQKSDVFWVSEKRSVPSAFKLFTGQFGLDDALSSIHRLLYMGVGQPPKSSPYVLCKFPLLTRGILSYGHL
ncbi:hypothetical protein Sjap_011183 [Stephania japonica]|uniref:Uncharacterized protein n=1 Tax=Stephania japonica TaxID=461633 RepID=A0AAP0JCV1_9MAGN